MLTLITATPGSGKTLFCVGLILDYLKSDEPRFIYHNIIGLNIDSPFLRLAPDDWREVPDGSIIFYDECQEIFPATGKAGRVDDQVLTDLETHRHRGIDIYFITQHPTFVHHHIRKLVTEHIHLYRAAGVSGAIRYLWSHVVLDPNDRGEQSRANSIIFRFNKEHFKLYKSTVLNTHKFRLPRKGWYFIIAIFCIAVFVIYSLSDGLNSISSVPPVPPVKPLEGAKSQAATLPLPSATEFDNPVSRGHWASSPTIPAVAGCVHFPSRSKCLCYAKNGLQLDLSYAQCVSALTHPLPVNINIESSTRSSSHDKKVKN